MKIAISKHAMQRLRERRPNFRVKDGGTKVHGPDALHIRLAQRLGDGHVSAEPPRWYRGRRPDGCRYVMITPSMCATLQRAGRRTWVCTTVMTQLVDLDAAA